MANKIEKFEGAPAESMKKSLEQRKQTLFYYSHRISAR